MKKIHRKWVRVYGKMLIITVDQRIFMNFKIMGPSVGMKFDVKENSSKAIYKREFINFTVELFICLAMNP